MNILLLVSGFLVLMAFGIFTFTKQSLSSVAKQHYFATHLDLERKAQNGVQKITFLHATKKERTKGEKKEPAKPRKKNPFLRDRVDPLEDSKLDISPLFQQPPPAFFDRLHEIAATDLHNLYAHTALGLLAKKHLGGDFAYQILDALIEKGRKEKEDLSFENLTPDEAHLKEIYLKMVKGTKQYTLPSRGYPPLGDFFLFATDKKRKPFFFCFASTPLLRAAFGEAIAQEILQEEETLCLPLKKQALQALLLKHPESKMQLANFNELMSTKRRASAPAPAHTLTDRESKISQKVRQPQSKGSPSS